MHTSILARLFMLGILALEICANGVVEESFRLVITFRTTRDNNLSQRDLPGMRIVKRYGRRLVVNLGRPFDLDVERLFFMGKFKSVERVDRDILVGVQQVDIGRLVIEDTMDVSPMWMEMNASNPNVEAAYVDPSTQTPLWNLRDSEPYSISVEGVWKITNSTPEVVVAVIDTGIASVARDAFLNLLDGYDFISDSDISVDDDERDPDPTDPGDFGDWCPTSSWHGTKVASILAARHDNEWGMKGVAQNCSLLPVRVLGLCRMGYASDVADAIVWAAGGAIDEVPSNPNPAKIISLSLAGQGECPDYLQSAVTQAEELGAVVIAAAGNNNRNVSGFFPANCKGVVAVAASTRDGRLAAYSNWGNLIAVSAPGGDAANAIMALSVDPMETGLEVSYSMGTSFAAPHVAGIVSMGRDEVFSLYINIMRNSPHSSRSICNIQQWCTGTFINASRLVIFATGTCALNSWSQCANDAEGFYFCLECSCDAGKAYAHRTTLLFCDGDGWCYYKQEEMCYNCPANHYCPGGLNSAIAWTVTTCTAGNFLSTIPSATANGVCSACTANKYCTGDTSQPVAWTVTTCTAGNYLSTIPSATANGVCSPCTANKYCTGGTSQPVAWTVTTCTAGNYLSTIPSATANGVCSPCTCDAGRFWASPCGGSLPGSCNLCRPGTFSAAAGVTSCTNCTAGTYRITSGGNSSSSCTPCEAGKYSTVVGAAFAENCTSCPVCSAGTFRSNCSGSSIGNCTACTPNHRCSAGNGAPIPHAVTTCPAGRFLSTVPSSTTDGVCSQCTAGKYKVGVSAATSCTDCLAGTASAALGATTIANCTSCVAGKYSSLNGSDTCITCENPTCASTLYRVDCTQTSDTECRSCTTHAGALGPPPANAAFTSLNAAPPNHCPWICNTGFYRNGSSGSFSCQACTTTSNACGTGKYRALCNSLSGHTSDAACSDCDNAPSNSVYTSFSTGGAGVSSCPYACNAGFSQFSGSADCCRVCNVGFFSSGCTKASPGTCVACSN